MAEHCAPGTVLIAETGGLNAMIVDSTALPEQAVQSVIESAFQSAGQRCSALRCLYVQEDIAEDFTKMLVGAMETLHLGNPWHLSTDIGPVIDSTAKKSITDHIAAAQAQGRVLASLSAPEKGTFIPPALISVRGISDLEREVFGPVLHLATFKANELDQVIEEINATGYGLTFGLHTRIDDRVQYVAERIHAGNVYINRNQIGAIVGSQPFGGEGLSGTGPKAGGPNYLPRFAQVDRITVNGPAGESIESLPALPAPSTSVSATLSLPGPTGESNRLSTISRPALLCMGPGPDTTARQARAVRALGGCAVEARGQVDPAALTDGPGYGGVMWWGDAATARTIEQALSRRAGPIIPMIPGLPDTAHVLAERHVCVDTTASGGNAALLGASS
jgi:RHH-type proline utilization regulon transcriptional repressor/proline dehydrogenase/delta 1-pyrroline-5-carboxylate dehydrogenase